MNLEPDDWSPNPELLAAYFDGELAGRPDLMVLRRRIADWVRSHPEARAVLEDYRRLAQLWRDTTPPQPSAACWGAFDAGLAAVPVPAARRWIVRWSASLAAVAAAVALAAWFGWGGPSAPRLAQETPATRAIATAAALEILPVATAEEVTILRVEGDDTQTVVVGELPLHGPLELAGPGEVALTSVQPDARDRMMPQVRFGGAQRPMIWALVAAETMEP